ncbi:MAG: hypothetical protein NXI11_00905 [Proteobacteria bacterium]|nr:hypothetical protein [Pseudomonadota bacterium]
MSIIAYTGLPGAYKTYSAVENWIIPALRDGRTVVHNLKLREEACYAASGGKGKLIQVPRYDDDAEADAGEYARRADELIELTPPGAVSIIDEIWQYWPAGVAVSKVPRRHLSFFKEHRQRLEPEPPHRAAEMLVIDQDLGTAVAHWIRALVESTYIHTKLDDVGASNRFRVDIYRRAQSIDKPREKQFTRSCYGKFKQEVGDCYITHARTEGAADFEAGLETKVDKRNTIWGSFRVRAAIASVLLMPFVAWWLVESYNNLAFGEATKEPPEREVVTPAQPKPIQQPVARAAPVPTPRLEPPPTDPPHEKPQADEPAIKEHGEWRLVGVLVRADGSGIASLSSATGFRRVDARECSHDLAGEWTCIVDGKLVARWTGKKAAIASAAAAPKTYQSR